MKRSILLILVIAMMIFGLSACAQKQEADGVRTYTVEGKFNSDTVNQWKTLYLLDEDHYLITVYALDSQDAERVTADFYMAGKYITNPDGSVTLQPGYGYADLINGETPVSLEICPDVNGQMSSIYYSVIGQFDTFILNRDGTWTGA